MSLDLVLDRSSPVPLADQLEAQLRLRIADGALTPGQRLPTIRALAKQLGLNPNTVAASYERLEAEGYLVQNRRAGTRVADMPPKPKPASALTRQLGAELAERLTALELDVHEAVTLLTVEAAGRRARRPLLVAVLARSPLAAERAAARCQAILGDRFRCVPTTPENYRSSDVHLTVIDPDLTGRLQPGANVLAGSYGGLPARADAYGPDFPAGAD